MKHWFCGLLAAAVLCVSSTSSARTFEDRIRDFPDEGWIAIGLNAVDKGTTAYCVDRRTCTEVNPIVRGLFGKRPSEAEMAAAFVLTSTVTFASITLLQDRNPHRARRAAKLAAIVQGGIVALNARILF